VNHGHGGRRLPRRPQSFDPYEVTAIYENPATGWRESVPRRAWLWMLLFGLFYMAARNLWRPFAFTLVVLIGTLVVAWPLLFIVAPYRGAGFLDPSCGSGAADVPSALHAAWLGRDRSVAPGR
jgi:hypothetical protein